MEEEKPAAAKAARTVRAPLIATIAVIGIAATGYYAFYRNQTIYYTGRNLRLISTLTAQIRGRAGMYSSFFKDGVAIPEAQIEAHDKVKDVQTGIVETPRGPQFRVQDTKGAGGNLPLDLLLKPIFARRVSSAFDVVLLADAGGQILFSLRTPPPASSLLGNEDGDDDDDDDLSARNAERLRGQIRAKKERESGATLSIANLGALYEKKGWREYTPLNPSSLLVSTRQSRVVLGDDEYLLFTQPYVLAYREASTEGKTKQLIVCGLVGAPRFRYSVTAVSVSVVFVAVGIALLALCCWPFLRIALIHPSEELTLTDVALLVVCTTVGACVLTLAALDVFGYHRLAKEADDQLDTFSQRVVADFAGNVRRAMVVLEHIEQAYPVPANNALTTSQPIPAELTAAGVIGAYPYVDSVAWMDGAGHQVLRFAAQAQGQVPLTESGYRQYYRDALKGRTWTVGDQPYVLEWVRSRATGEVRAVLAKHRSGADGVIALSTDLIDLTNAVRPPGVQFAIIEESGEVVYHSDTERIGYENFFAETDRNRDLRSAVLARHAATVDASYWGEDQSMFVRPLAGSPWTLVTFRAKRLARVLNVEAALLTIVLLLLAAAPYIVLYIVTLIAVPRYRAPSIWPDEPRRLDYLRLCIIYLALLILFGLTAYVLKPWSAFYAVLLIPAIATLSTYLVLHRSTNRRRFNAAAALWIIANAFLFVVLLRYDVAQERFFSGYPRTAHIVLVVIAVIIAALTAVLMSTSRGKKGMTQFLVRVPIRYTHLYRAGGVLLLLLCTTLPVTAFFNISREVQADLLVKYGQLRAAADLEGRIERLERLSVESGGIPVKAHDIERPDILGKMFGSTWALCLGKTIPCDSKPTATIARMLPAMYEDSTAIRPLFAQGSADCLWRWSSSNEEMKLTRKVRFDPDVTGKLWPNAKTEDQAIEIDTPRPPISVMGGADALSALLCGLALLAVFWYATGFIASRVLLIDVSEPDWMARLPLSPTLGDHIFLVRRDRDAKSITGSDPMPFIDVSFEELARTGQWDQALAKLDSSAAGKNIRILDFEHGVHDESISAQKLRWLERLMALPDRTVVILSAYTPAFLFTIAPADTLARWRALLDRFVVVTAEELELRHQEWQRRKDYRTRSRLAPSEPKNWLQRETQYNPFLRRLREELEPDGERAHLLDEIGERAETYYAGLWSTCRSDEKLMLYQLAHNGLANGRNRRALRRLIARGLVRRGPNIELFSETFRLYVLAAAQRENLVSQARAEYGNSTWDMLRIPFFVVIISFLLLLFATQKDLLTTTTALATALTTGLPVIMKLIGVFAEKRGGTPSSS